MRDQIYVLAHKKTTHCFDSKDSFEFRPKLGYVWAQKLAFSVLRKIGCYRQYKEESFERTVIEKDDLIAKIYAAQGATMRFLMERPGTLYIGAEDFEKLMSMPQINSMLQMDLSVRWNNRGGFTMIGMRVIVVPWMRGFLPVPDDLVAK